MAIELKITQLKLAEREATPLSDEVSFAPWIRSRGAWGGHNAGDGVFLPFAGRFGLMRQFCGKL
jgi:hypothetical protein